MLAAHSRIPVAGDKLAEKVRASPIRLVVMFAEAVTASTGMPAAEAFSSAAETLFRVAATKQMEATAGVRRFAGKSVKAFASISA